jgi:hypothetical protein
MADDLLWDVASPEEVQELNDTQFMKDGWLTRRGTVEVTEDDFSPTWTDYGKTLAADSLAVGEGLLAGAQQVTGSGGIVEAGRQAIGGLADDIRGSRTPIARELAGAQWTGDEGAPSAWDDPAGALGIQATSAMPSLAAAIGMGYFLGPVAARLTVGGISGGSVADQMLDEVDNASEEDLWVHSDAYAGMRDMGHSDEEARAALKDQLSGLAPLATAAVSMATGGIEGMVAGRFAGEAGKGLVRGAIAGAASEAGQEAAEAFVGDVGKDITLAQEGVKDGIDWNSVFNDVVAGGVIGGVTGGALGGAAGIRFADPKRDVDPAVETALSQAQPNLDDILPPEVAPAPASPRRRTAKQPPPTSSPEPAAAPAGPPPLAGAPSSAIVPEQAPVPAAGPVAPPVATGVEPQSSAPPVIPGSGAGAAARSAPVPSASVQPDPVEQAVRDVVTPVPTDQAVTEVVPNVSTPSPQDNPTPEPKKVIEAQLQDLADGVRRAVWLPKGQGLGGVATPAGMARYTPAGGILIYDPKALSKQEITKAIKEQRLNDILNMGPTSKVDAQAAEAAGATPAVLQVTKPDGTPVVEAATTSETIDQDAAAMEAQAAPGDTVVARDPAEVIAEREAMVEEESPIALEAIDATVEDGGDLPSIEEINAELGDVPPQTAVEEVNAELKAPRVLVDQKAAAEVRRKTFKKTKTGEIGEFDNWDDKAVRERFKGLVKREGIKETAPPHLKGALKALNQMAGKRGKAASNSDEIAILNAAFKKEKEAQAARRAAAEEAKVNEEIGITIKEVPVKEHASVRKAREAYTAKLKEKYPQLPAEQLEQLARDYFATKDKAGKKGMGSGAVSGDKDDGGIDSGSTIAVDRRTPEDIMAESQEEDSTVETEARERTVKPVDVATAVTAGADKTGAFKAEKKRSFTIDPTKARPRVTSGGKLTVKPRLLQSKRSPFEELVALRDELRAEIDELKSRESTMTPEELAALEEDLRDELYGDGEFDSDFDYTDEDDLARVAEWQEQFAYEQKLLEGQFEAKEVNNIIRVVRDDGSVVYGATTDEFTVNDVLREDGSRHRVDGFKPVFGGLEKLIYNQISNKLLQTVGSVKIHVVTDETLAQMTGTPYAAGFYATEDHRIVLRESALRGDPEEFHRLVVHEAMHSVTAQTMEDSMERDWKGRRWVEEIDLLMEEALDHMLMVDPRAGGAYGFSNAFEFVAEAFSNPYFQDYLKSVPISDALRVKLKIKSWSLGTLWGAFVDKLRSMIGLPGNATSAMEAIVSITETMMRAKNPAERTMMAKRFTDRRMLEKRGPSSQTISLKDLRDGAVDAVTPSIGARNVLMKAATLDQLRQWYGHVSAHFTRIVNLLQKVTPYANRIRQASDVLGQKYADYEKRNPKEAQEFADLAIQATMLNVRLVDGVTGSAIRQVKSGTLIPGNEHLGKDGRTTWQAKSRLPALQDRYNKLSPEGRALYKEMTTFYRRMQNAATQKLVSNTILRTVKGLTDAQVQDLTSKVVSGTLGVADEKLVGGVVFKMLKEIRRVRVIGGDYFPLMRHGHLVVNTTDIIDPGSEGKLVKPDTVEFRGKSLKEVNQKVGRFVGQVEQTVLAVRELDDATSSDFIVQVQLQTQGTHFFDTEADAKRFRDEEIARGTSVSQVLPRAETGHGSSDLTQQQMSAIMSSLEQRFQGEGNESNRKILRTALQQASVRMMSGNRVQQRSLTRRKVQGASTEFATNVLAYGESMSRYMARLEFWPEINEELAAFRKELKDLRHDKFAPMRSALMNELDKRLADGNFGAGEQPRWMSLMLGASFLDKLASPAYSLVNSLQPGMVAYPVLAGRYGAWQAAKALTKAYRSVGALSAFGKGAKNTWKAGRGFADFGLNMEDIAGSVRAKLSAEHRVVFDKLIEQGALDPQAGFELASAVSTRQGKVGNTIARFDRIARQLPISVEVVNRTVTAIAAYDLAKQAGAKDPVQVAFDAVQNTQGDYSEVNAPRFFKSTAGRFVLQFKKYAQMMYALMGRQLHQTFRGATREERWVAARQLAYLTGVQVMMAGVIGIPGVEIIKLGFMAAAGLGLGEGWEDWEQDVRKSLAEMVGKDAGDNIAKGVIPRTFGIDLSTRVGLDSLLFFGEPRDYDRDGVLGWMTGAFAGAPAGLVFDQFSAARNFADGVGSGSGEDFLKGFEKLPGLKILSDTVKASRKAVYGETSPFTGKQTVEPQGLLTSAVNIMGLTTAGQAEARDARSAMFAERGRMVAEGRSAQQLKNRFAEGTVQERNAILRELKAFNADLPKDKQLTPKMLWDFRRRFLKDKDKGLTMDGFRVTNPAEVDRMQAIKNRYDLD